MADEAARAHAAEVARAQEEGRDPPPPPPNPAGDVNAQPQAGAPTIGDYDSADAFFMDRNPIHPPPPARNDYEIKPQIIALCKLFSFSLGDKASRWLKSLPAHSITTWDEYKAAFINHFYTKQRSISVRNKISTFRQANNESFYEALDRFKEYIRDCPNHGFNEENDAESGFTKLLDLCKCTDRGSMGIEHKDWLLSTLCNYGFWIKLKQKYD
ncbi:unnamed protein product [Microthlaspi erraticum]|uniref:Retrotransposon gag domain-containing protein n=1 Tax=Microthlaspi erraticum TaxID=1685480 RepID=A0A6D2KPX5_9BRAS|nr:unnamed protein product [Microthlaspi erraticum]